MLKFKNFKDYIEYLEAVIEKFDNNDAYENMYVLQYYSYGKETGCFVRDSYYSSSSFERVSIFEATICEFHSDRDYGNRFEDERFNQYDHPSDSIEGLYSIASIVRSYKGLLSAEKERMSSAKGAIRSCLKSSGVTYEGWY